MACSQGLVKIFLFTTNFVFLLAGIGLLVVGIIFTVTFSNLCAAIPSDFSTLAQLPYLIIGLGVIIFIVAFLGSYGAWKEVSWMLVLYGAILIVIFFLQTGLVIYSFGAMNNKEYLKTEISKAMTTTLFNNYYENNKATRPVVDLIQQKFECCGATSVVEWKVNIPPSCYPDSNPKKYIPFIFGCSTVFPQYFVNSLQTILIVALGIAAAEMVGALLAIYLSSSIRKQVVVQVSV